MSFSGTLKRLQKFDTIEMKRRIKFNENAEKHLPI